MTIEEIRKFIEENKSNADVTKFIKELITNDILKEKIFEKNSLGEQVVSQTALKDLGLQSYFDKYHAKGLESFKNNTMKSEIEKAVKEATQGKELTEEQKRIAELEKIVADTQNKDLLNNKIKAIQENEAFKGVSAEILSKFVDINDDSKTNTNLELFSKQLNSIKEAFTTEKNQEIENIKKDFLNGAARTPAANKPEGEGGLYTSEQLDGMSKDQILANYDKVMESYQKI